MKNTAQYEEWMRNAIAGLMRQDPAPVLNCFAFLEVFHSRTSEPRVQSTYPMGSLTHDNVLKTIGKIADKPDDDNPHCKNADRCLFDLCMLFV